MKENILKNCLCLIYPAAVLIYTLNLFFEGVRPGILLTAVLILGVVCIFLLRFVTLKTNEDRLFAAYFIFNMLSGIWCVFYGIPVSVYLGEVSTTALPMLMYYAGRGFTDKESSRFYQTYIASALFMGLLGVLLYIWAPQFYLDFSYDNYFISVADVETSRVRMNSVIGSGALAVFLTYGVCLSIVFIRDDSKKKKAAGTVTLILSVLLAFMANQRSAMFSIILMLVFFNVVDYFIYKDKPKKLLWMELLAAGVFIAGLFIFARGVFEKFYARLASIPSGFGERSESWVAAVNDMHNIFLGDGLGSRGHRAAVFQHYIVADGGLVKLYTEMGVIGTSLIIFLLFLVYKKSLKNIGAVVGEIAVITCAVLMSVGSNVLEMELCAPIVYFCLGRAVKKIS
ncbi:MAG: hypothetical protein J6P45_10230 [Lachnospiraceae bacterium]|nr:hypothetical protein [Lachnospiraceae bacterium]